MSMMVNSYALAVGQATLTYVTSTDNPNALTEYPFNAHAIGTASPDRYLVFEIGSNSNARTVASVTVNGAACTVIRTIASSVRSCALVVTDAPVTTGTTADIVVTFNAGENGCLIAVYTLTGASSPTPHDHKIDSGTGGRSVTLNIPAGGAAIAAFRNSDNAGATSAFTGLTRDFEEYVDASIGVLAGANDEFESADATHAISVTGAGECLLIAASWGP